MNNTQQQNYTKIYPDTTASKSLHERLNRKFSLINDELVWPCFNIQMCFSGVMTEYGGTATHSNLPPTLCSHYRSVSLRSIMYLHSYFTFILMEMTQRMWRYGFNIATSPTPPFFAVQGSVITLPAQNMIYTCNYPS